MNYQHTSLSYYSSLVERGRHEAFAIVLKITPEIAARMLENNPDNRRLNRASVSAIVNSIRSGDWMLNGETIVISKEGLLNDGQTRLTAIVETGIAVESFVVFGISRAALSTYDNGRSRTVNQHVSMAGISDGAALSKIVTLYTLYTKGKYTRRRLTSTEVFITEPEVVSLLKANEKSYRRALEVGNRQRKDISNVTAIATAYMILSGVNFEQSELFFEKLATGANLPEGSPILALRDRLRRPLVKENKDKDVQHLDQHNSLELILRAWNAWRLNQKVTQLKMMGNYPTLEV